MRLCLIPLVLLAEGLAFQMPKTMESKILGETRRYIVHLPESYEKDAQRRFPVLYVLDGGSNDVQVAGSAAKLGLEAIVVGLPNGRGARNRDNTPPFLHQDAADPASALGQGDRFIAFLQDEMIPRVEGEYRTSDVRMLWGHSRTALTVIYSMMLAPELFQVRFAHSPALWHQDDLIVGRVADALERLPKSSFLYMSLGTKEGGKMEVCFEKMRAALQEKAKFRWVAERTEDADHQTNRELGTPAGFRALVR